MTEDVKELLGMLRKFNKNAGHLSKFPIDANEVAIAISTIKEQSERIEELELSIETFLTDNSIGREHQSVDWVAAFNDVLGRTKP